MTVISQTTFSSAISLNENFFWIKFHWKGGLTPYETGDKPLSEAIMVCFTETCGTRFTKNNNQNKIRRQKNYE